ncbi:MAG: hypothetical protein J6T99_07470 [Oscillospiraceae bacterium]|nr:hypothetical protein [Oscillospiraceae bacterium]
MATKSGFEFAVDPRILTDWRFTMAVAKTQSGKDIEKLAGVEQMASLLLGDEQYQKLLEHVAEQNQGFVPAEAVIAEMTEIMEAAKEVKN